MRELLFKIYIFLYGLDLKYDLSRETMSRVHDHFGMIDTLGFDAHKGFFTFSYSSEIGGCHGIFIPFGYCFTMLDDRIEFHKFNELSFY